LQELFTAEALIPLVGSFITPLPEDPSKKGRMYLTFEVNGKKTAWEGEVSFVPQQ
jgi:hypothetical protein